jgi:hypothetical protein
MNLEFPEKRWMRPLRLAEFELTRVPTFWLVVATLLAGASIALCAEEPLTAQDETSEIAPLEPSNTGGAIAPVGPIQPARPVAAPNAFSASGQSSPSEGKVRRYAAKLLKQLDRNRNGVLEPAEWPISLGSFASADANADGHLSEAELFQAIWARGRNRRLRPAPEGEEPAAAAPGAVPSVSPDPARPAAVGNPQSDAAKTGERGGKQFYVGDFRLPQGLPPWFVERDKDGDGQLTLSEFSAGDSAGIPGGFEAYDVNHDGILTAEECLTALSAKPTNPTIPAPPSDKK